MAEKMKPNKSNVLGMELDEWKYESCIAHVGIGIGWATLYDIASQFQGQGHATKLLKTMKLYYEKQGKKFGGTVALNPRMAWLYKKLNIEEYK